MLNLNIKFDGIFRRLVVIVGIGYILPVQIGEHVRH
jgi:hypothetical protein